VLYVVICFEQNKIYTVANNVFFMAPHKFISRCSADAGSYSERIITECNKS